MKKREMQKANLRPNVIPCIIFRPGTAPSPGRSSRREFIIRCPSRTKTSDRRQTRQLHNKLLPCSTPPIWSRNPQCQEEEAPAGAHLISHREGPADRPTATAPVIISVPMYPKSYPYPRIHTLHWHGASPLCSFNGSVSF